MPNAVELLSKADEANGAEEDRRPVFASNAFGVLAARTSQCPCEYSVDPFALSFLVLQGDVTGK